MSEIKEVILPIGGMNSDDAYNVMPDGDYPPFAYGLRSSVLSTGNNKACENIRGTKKPDYSLPPGKNKCIGWCQDYENNGYIYFIYNSNDIHKIVQYIPSTNTFNDFQSTIFNFNLNHKIYHADKIGDMLYWTDNYNPPRKVNLKTLFSNGYINFDEQVLDVIKYPCIKSPVCKYGSNYSYKYNLLRGKLFQFAIRYVYDDYEKSCLSPVSKVPLPQNEETHTGMWLMNQYINNCITIVFNTGHETVKKIEIIAREGNIGDWYLVKTIDKYDINNNVLINSNTFAIYNFYNDTQGEILDQDDAARPFDYVPQIAGCQSVIEKNMLVYGDITEGYDNYPIDIKLNYNCYLKDFIETKYYTSILNSQQISNSPPTWKIHLTFDFNINDINYYDAIYINIINSDQNINFTVTQIYSENDTYNTLFTRIINDIGTHEYIQGSGYYYIAAFNYNTSSNIITLVIVGYPQSDPTYQSASATIQKAITTKYKSWAAGWIEFGIVYYDRANRSGAVNVSNQSLLYIKTYGEDYTTPYIPAWTSGEIVREIVSEIHHKPPLWATHYQWVYCRKDSWTRFIDVPITSITTTANGFIEIDINSTLLNIASANKKSILNSYIWQKGDRIRFIKKYDINSNTFSYVQKLLDFEINGQDATGKIFIDYFDYAYYGFGQNTIVKIYSPRKTLQQKIFYEFGEIGEIGDAGTPTAYHKKTSTTGFDQNYSTGTPCISCFDS